MDQYRIHQSPERYQSAQHFQSSLDQPNLDNVQAKLYAIKQRNYEMAQNYFKQKYGSGTAYDQFLESTNMVDLRPVNRYQQEEEYNQYSNVIGSGLHTQLLKKHLEMKAREIQKQQLEKINGNSFDKKDSTTVHRRRTSAKANPWLQKTSNSRKNTTSNHGYNNRRANNSNNQNIRIEESRNQQEQNCYERQQHSDVSIEDHQQIVNLNSSNNENQKKGKFLNQFKQYLANKNKYKEGNISRQQYNIQSAERQNLSPNKNLSPTTNMALAQSKILKSSLGFNQSGKNFGHNFSNNKSQLSNNNASMQKPQVLSAEEQLVKKIFKNIKGKNVSVTSKNEYLQKIQLAEYLSENERILSVLGVKADEILYKLQNQLQTKDADKVKFHQCLLFVYKLLNKQEEQKQLLAKHSFSDIPDGCMLPIEIVKQFEKIFKNLDRHNDLIVKRLDFIERLALDPTIKKVINSPAVYEEHIDKTVSMRRIFERIEVETILNEKPEGSSQSHSKQFISWAEFINYFTSGHTERSKYDILTLVESLKNQEKFGFNNVPESVFQVLSQVIVKLDKGEQYFNTQDIVAEILISKVFELEKYTFVRGKGQDIKSTNIPMETFEEVLVRIKQTAPRFLTIKQFMEYFSDKGRPTEIHEQQINQKIRQCNQPALVTKMEDALFSSKDKELVEGYDSDPQFYNNSNVYDRKQFRKTFNNNNQFQGKSKGRFNNSQNNFNQNYQTVQNNMANKLLKVTVPQPFQFQQRQKQRMMQRQQKSRLNRSASQSKSEKFSQFQFKAKEIPQKVKQVGLFDRMIEENQKKIDDRRKCSMLLTLANEQPFSFYDRKTKKKTHQQRQQFVFKANPIPWYCSVNLLKKKQEKNINRNEKIARMAQQSLNKAKLPPRMEKDFQQKMARKALQSAQKEKKDQNIIRAKQPPNFEVLHKQFQLALERKRKQNKTTQIQQFKFKDAKRDKKAKDINQELQKLQEPKQDPQSWRKTLKSSINVFASSTAKFDQQVEKRRLDMQEKKKKENEKRKQEEKRAHVNEDLKKKLHSMSKLTEKKQEIVNQAKRQEMKKQQQNFKAIKEGWLQKAKKQPLLVERPLKRDQKIEKMKKLYQISETLKKNGIKGKQHDTYFKRDELLLLQDYALLKDKL